MAKDPAFLFYSSDFLTGTILMTNEQIGIYVKLLCVLHQHGGELDIDAFDAFIGQHEIIRTKFRCTEDGKVFNVRLMEEMAKRAKKSTSLSINAKKRWKKHCKSNAIASDLHMPIEDEDEDEDEDTNTTKNINTTKPTPKPKKAVTFVKDNPPTVEEVAKYCQERKNGIDAQNFHDKNTTIGWLDKNKIPYRDWKAVIRTWEGYRKATAPQATPTPAKRPIGIVVVEKIAAGKSNHDILHELIGTYSEHAINEALMQARGKVE